MENLMPRNCDELEVLVEKSILLMAEAEQQLTTMYEYHKANTHDYELVEKFRQNILKLQETDYGVALKYWNQYLKIEN